ncbi:MAG: winged helix-turn-helix domain-containing protein, partial [Candidatus Nitrosopolaris sp.]
GATKTKLMYSASISFNQLREYLSLLVENGLIQYEEGTHTYRSIYKTKLKKYLRLFTSPRI